MQEVLPEKGRREMLQDLRNLSKSSLFFCSSHATFQPAVKTNNILCLSPNHPPKGGWVGLPKLSWENAYTVVSLMALFHRAAAFNGL